jgi:DNA-binding NarL/FixJ family response regulator
LRQPTAQAVLVVEDETIVAHDLEQMLEELGYDTCGIAASADEALARAGKKRPDIALVDIRIKGKLDGIKTAELLHERFGTPVVYLTAHADDATVQRAARTRPRGYLLKPVKRSALKSTLSVALYNHAAEGEERDGASAAAAAPPSSTELPAPTPAAVRRQIDQIYASADFDASRRSREFLRFIVT